MPNCPYWLYFPCAIGSIGLMLYGLRLTSEGLQKAIGDGLRKMLATMSRHPLEWALMGALVAMTLQNPGATAAMTAGYVEAGLMLETQALAVVAGSGLGIAISAWLVAGAIAEPTLTCAALPILAVALPLASYAHRRGAAWGQTFSGLALVMLSLPWLASSLAGALAPDAPLEWSIGQDGSPDGSVLTAAIWALAGCGLTAIVQTPIVTLAIAATTGSLGMTPCADACAMMLGASIGAILPPLMAARRMGPMARRIALSLLAGCTTGVLAFGIAFFPTCRFICGPCSTTLGIADTPEGLPLSLALYYTALQLTGLVLTLLLTRPLRHLTARISPPDAAPRQPQTSAESGHLSSDHIPSGELALAQAMRETALFGQSNCSMMDTLRLMLTESLGSERQMALLGQIVSAEQQSDRKEMEIATFVGSIPPQSLSDEGDLMTRSLYKMVDELESIADSICHIARALERKSEQRIFFSPEQNGDVRHIIELTRTAMYHMSAVIDRGKATESDLNKAYNNEDEINNFRAQARGKILDPAQRVAQAPQSSLKASVPTPHSVGTSGGTDFEQNTFYMEIINECERIGDHIINVIAALFQAS